MMSPHGNRMRNDLAAMSSQCRYAASATSLCRIFYLCCVLRFTVPVLAYAQLNPGFLFALHLLAARKKKDAWASSFLCPTTRELPARQGTIPDGTMISDSCNR